MAYKAEVMCCKSCPFHQQYSTCWLDDNNELSPDDVFYSNEKAPEKCPIRKHGSVTITIMEKI